MSLFCDDGCYPVAHHYSPKRRSSRADGSSFEVASVASRSAKDKYSLKVPTPFGTVKFNESHTRNAAKASRAKASRFSAASNIYGDANGRKKLRRSAICLSERDGLE
ncbi:unnamed protein product [Adineta steineri]|uniref:Uncharacterized protein n=1 Tax=Adineta steineri TaxID=433720 RepID=A0A814V084_9BILA|nr:unnamed protein product [Adineta steineri]